MKRYEYLFKDILFALRLEYLKNEEQLNLLKQYMWFDKNKIEDFNFKLYKPYVKNQNVELMINIIEKRTRLQKIFGAIDKKLDLYGVCSGKPKSRELVKNNNNEYFILDNTLPIGVVEHEQKEFCSQVDTIVNSDFAKNVENLYVPSFTIPVDCTLIADASCLNMCDSSDKFSTFYCNYYANVDQICVARDKGLSEYFMKTIFNSRFPSVMFSDYYQNIIESSDVFGKRIEFVGDISNDIQASFSIIEDGKKLVLKKN